MESDYELIGRIAEQIFSHDIYYDQLGNWECPHCGVQGDGMGQWGTHLAKELVEDFRLQRITRWVPRMIDGERGTPVGSWHEAQMLMEVRPDVSSVDREYRFVSRWINPRE
jgi:hypothetical protein